MTYVVISRSCKYCGDAMNHCGDRGNGKQRDFCDRECSRKMYIIKKRIANYIAYMELRKHIVDKDGEFAEGPFKFIQLVSEYFDTGLPAKKILVHLNAALDGKNMVPVKEVFQNMIEWKRKRDA